MPRFVLDTNVYIAAQRSRDQAEALAAFYAAALPLIVLHAVVAQELLAGAVGAHRQRAMHDDIVGPFERRRRVIAPFFTTWVRTGAVIAELVETRAFSPEGFTRSFVNDVLLAVSCREHGLTLVTTNVGDFERIRRVIEFDFVAPWPVV